MTLSLRGLGEYPGFYCYDKGRPDWLPYWWDTWGESVCKFKAAPANIVACLNPWDTSCASTSEVGSYVNVREVVGLPVATPNRDPSVSGPGMAKEEGERTNAPASDPLGSYFWPGVIVIGTLILIAALNK